MSNRLVISKYSLINKNKTIIDCESFFENSKNLDFKKMSKEIYQLLKIDYPKFFKMDSLSKLGFLGTELLSKEDNLLTKYSPEKIGVFIQNKYSSLDTDIAYQKTIAEDNYYPSPSVFVYTLPNIVIGEICIRNHFKGEQLCLINEIFNPDIYIDYITSLFENGTIECCLCGWIDYYQDSFESFLCLVEYSNSENILLFNSENLYLLFKQ